MLQSNDPSSVSDAKLAANRLNTRKSTGPRTPHGKAVAARNSLKHGVFAKSLLLPGEDPAELTALKTALLRRHNPRDPMELLLVERIVAASWKLQRLERFEAQLYQLECDAWDQNPVNSREAHGLGRREPIPAEVAWASASPEWRAQLDRLGAQGRQLESALHRNLRQLTILQQQAIPAIVDDHADHAIVAEHSALQNRENQATTIEQLTRRAAIEAIQETRREREAEKQRVIEQNARNQANREARARRHALEEATRAQRRAQAIAEYNAQTLGNGATPAAGATALPLPVPGERAGERAPSAENSKNEANVRPDCT